MDMPLLNGIREHISGYHLIKRGSTFYHGTRPSLVDKILREGLLPSYMGTGEMTKGEKREYPSISLATDMAYARGYSNMGAVRDAKGIIPKLKAHISSKHPVLKIDIPEGETMPEIRHAISVGDRKVDEYLYPTRIPPEWITVIERLVKSS
jgi:hypothetical protein